MIKFRQMTEDEHPSQTPEGTIEITRLSFDPPNLRDEVVMAVRLLNEDTGITLWDWDRLHCSDFDFDDVAGPTITHQTYVTVDIPYCSENPEIQIKDLLILARQG